MQAVAESFISLVLASYLAVFGFVTDTVERGLALLETAPTIMDTAVSVHMPSRYQPAFNVAGSYVSLLDLLDAIQPASTTDTAENGETVTEDTIAVDNNVIAESEAAPEPAGNLDDAIVNIYCLVSDDSYRKSMSGTGFIINEGGVILTNAHVAQFLLLKNLPDFRQVECIVRTGEESDVAYQVELLYISPAWIIDHADLINDPEPKGTGENDFALLYITRTADGEELTDDLPFLTVDVNLLSTALRDQTVILAGYPILDDDEETDYDARRLATSTVPELYTFGSGYADLITLSGSTVGAEGASGGPVVNASGQVIGMIVTRADDEAYGSGSLRAITTSYINRTMQEETGFSLPQTIVGNLDNRSKIFNENMTPILTGLLADEL